MGTRRKVDEAEVLADVRADAVMAAIKLFLLLATLAGAGVAMLNREETRLHQSDLRSQTRLATALQVATDAILRSSR